MVTEDVMVSAAVTIVVALLGYLAQRKHSDKSGIILPNWDDMDLHIERKKHFKIKKFMRRFLIISLIFIILGLASEGANIVSSSIYIILFGIFISLIFSAKTSRG